MDKKEIILEELLEQQQAAAMPLPLLKPEKGIFSDYLDQFYEYIQSWLEALGIKPRLSLDEQWIEYFLYSIAAVLLLSILAFLYFLLMKYRLRSEPEIQIDRTEKDMPSENQPLLEALQTAQGAQAWAKAMRLRWRLFLYRLKLSDSTTPLQYAQATSDSLHNVLDVQTTYTKMFGAAEISSSDFEEYDRDLSVLEQGVSQHG